MESNPYNTSEQSAAAVIDWRPLRIWPPLLLLPCMIGVRFIPGLVENGPSMIWMASAFGPFLISLLLIAWWLFLSRASWRERGLGLLGLIAILVAIEFVVDPSMRGPLVIVMTIPMTIAGFCLGLTVLAKQPSMQRTFWSLMFALLLAGVSALVKSDGVWGNFAFEFDWRWTPTSEQRFLADREKNNSGESPVTIPIESIENAEWPGFRGPQRDGAFRGPVISDDWNQTPPKELWRIAIGPAWSSFAVAGNYLFTQEQRGENESVVCYEASTGKQVWEQSIPSRFFEGLGGLGPRATPTFAAGAIYATGAEGWLLKLQATDGKILWKTDLRKVSQRKELPMWGYSSSPWVDDRLVVVHAGGDGDMGIVALDIDKGEVQWSAPAGVQSYASVQEVTLLGKKLFCLLSDRGAHFLEPATGKVLFLYEWQHAGYRSLQPQIVDQDKVLIPTGMGTGTRLIQIVEDGSEWKGTELWTSKDMKPDFNDLVVHQGFAYGFDNAIFACIDLQNGKRKWKGGRYEKGQALLLANSNLILVVSEKGELVLLRANPDKLEELFKIPSLSAKTWNHPVVVGDRLFLRNSEEAVCYQLPTKQ